MELDRIICGDAISEMQKLSDCSVDLVLTSPPYNIRNSSGNGMKQGGYGRWKNAKLVDGYGSYLDNMPYDEYVDWQRK